MRAPALLVAGGLMLAGCGASDEEQIRTAVTEYRDAYLDGDDEGACAHLTEKGRRALANSLGRKTCPDAAAAARKALSEADRTALRQLRVERVKVDGEQAVVTLAAPRNEPAGGWRMVKIGGTWLLD